MIIEFLARLNKVLEENQLGRVIIVGGFATELYSGGAYRTGDIDIVIDTVRVREAREVVDRMLNDVGATRSSGRVYESSYFGPIALDIVGYKYVGRVKRLRVGDYHVYVESPEDNIAINLNACVYCNSDLDCEKAAAIMAAQWDFIDWGYLEDRCRGEGTLDKMTELRSRVESRIRGLRRQGS
ncbi:hypothetical protein [Vulcanisaeta thermophila]|uniref:hypothetical protein n=1 Tax=Vulcanisaeta thermophila TaxID=867917 RepID=UPI000853E99B|nr:hypothetical protein [Vulcanisaeta thermophila]